MSYVLTDIMSDDNNIEELHSKYNDTMNFKKHNLKSIKTEILRGK